MLTRITVEGRCSRSMGQQPCCFRVPSISRQAYRTWFLHVITRRRSPGHVHSLVLAEEKLLVWNQGNLQPRLSSCARKPNSSPDQRADDPDESSTCTSRTRITPNMVTYNCYFVWDESMHPAEGSTARPLASYPREVGRPEFWLTGRGRSTTGRELETTTLVLYSMRGSPARLTISLITMVT